MAIFTAFLLIIKAALEKLKKHRIVLEKAILFDMTNLAHEMNAASLLPDDIHEDIINPRVMLTEAQKATKVVSALKNKVVLNPHNLDKFVRILKKKPEHYEDIIDCLSPSQGQGIVHT